jgi:hypothetical protein
MRESDDLEQPTQRSTDLPARPAADPAPVCECNERLREFGHRYDCVYGPLRYLPARVIEEPLPPSSPTRLLIMGEPVRRSDWRVFRVLPLPGRQHAADQLGDVW